MSKLSITRACAAAALLTLSSAAFAQENTANTMNTVDPALNTTTADPMATDNVITTDPLANDPLATTTTDPLAADPMLNETDLDDDDGNDFPWGLLGLLGLAGLLGARRRDDDVRVDRTRDNR